MIAHRGTLRIWHWAHEAANPDCEADKESEWHLSWKALALDSTQEIKVGNRRADVLAPGRYAVELQASAMDAGEVHGREADWGAQGGMVWIFRAIKETAEKRITHRVPWQWFRTQGEPVIEVVWSHAPDRVRSARARAFLDLGNQKLLFVGGWWLDRPGPLTGYGWLVSKQWVVDNVLRGGVIPEPFGEDPEVVRARRAREAEERRRVDRLRRLVEQAAERERAEAARRRKAELDRQRQEDVDRLEWLEGIRRYAATAPALEEFVVAWFRWRSWLADWLREAVLKRPF